MKAVFEPSKASGCIQAPPSKSMAHRFMVCAGLSEKRSTVWNVDFSEDILATMDCLRALGADVRREERAVTVRGVDVRHAGPALLPCRECGSTLRFFIPLCLLGGEEMRLTGSGRLLQRPLSVYEKIAEKQGIFLRIEETAVTAAGRLCPGTYEIPGNISSQFVSGLLFALPLLPGESRITLLPPVESRAYIDMTMQALRRFGVAVSWLDDHTIRTDGAQRYAPAEVTVEGDYSNAAFFEALNLAGGAVRVLGLEEDSLQGDRVYRECFQKLRSGYAEIDLSGCPDLGPVLMAAAALLHGARFTGAGRLKLKESDRGSAMAAELRKMGVRAQVLGDEILVGTGLRRPREELDGHNDHRIVMALSVLLTVTGGTIAGAEAVRKSLPDFFDRLCGLGIRAAVE